MWARHRTAAPMGLGITDAQALMGDRSRRGRRAPALASMQHTRRARPFGWLETPRARRAAPPVVVVGMRGFDGVPRAMIHQMNQPTSLEPLLGKLDRSPGGALADQSWMPRGQGGRDGATGRGVVRGLWGGGQASGRGTAGIGPQEIERGRSDSNPCVHRGDIRPTPPPPKEFTELSGLRLPHFAAKVTHRLLAQR